MRTSEPFVFDPALVHEWLTRSAERHPDKVALICDGRRWTYRELDAASTRLARALAGRGLKRHDRVVIFLDNSAEAVISIYAVLKAGGVFAVVAGSLKAAKLSYILRNSGARALVTHTAKSEVVREAAGRVEGEIAMVWVGPVADIPPGPPGRSLPWEEMPADTGVAWSPPRCIDADLACLIYTSGSTGEPKGVMSTHRSVVSATRSIVQYIGNTPDDIVLDVLPLSFDYGLYQVLMAFMYGGAVVLEKSFMYLHPLLESIGRERVTGFPIVPTILAMLLKMNNLQKYDLGSLRYMTNTGAALPVEHIRRIREIVPRVKLFSMFGLTECKRVCFLPPEEVDRRPGSVGKAIPNCETFVVDESGREVAPGEVGELVVRGSNVMSGYWRDPGTTARAYRRREETGETVLHSGDYFKRDEEGYLYFLGRKDDMIKSRGERISAKEVENVLCELRGVLEAAVIGVPDEILGQAVKAFVVIDPASALTEKDIAKHCSANMESFMVPKRIAIVKDLPRTVNGKIDKLALKAIGGDAA